MIRRGKRPESNFTVLSNDLIRDDRLSYRARGVLVSILSRPDDWRVSRDALAREGREGRDAVGTAINELIEVGYAVRQKHQGENGKWVTEIVVFDQPATENPSSVTEGSGFSGTDDWKTDDWKTDAGKSVANRSTVTKNCEEENTHTLLGASSVLVIPDENPAPGRSPGPDSTEGFERWWEMYPKKKEKKACLAFWRRMSAADREAALAAIPKHRAFWDREGTDPQYIVYPIRWLRNGRWDDDLTPSAPAKRKGLLDQMDDAFAEQKEQLKEQLTGLHERNALNSPVLELPTETGDTP